MNEVIEKEEIKIENMIYKIRDNFVMIDRDFDMNITSIELKNGEKSIYIKPKEQLIVEQNRKTYTIEIDNKDLDCGVYETYIHANVNNTDYSRQIWCSDRSSKYVDSVNNLSLEVEKNRLTIVKS